ncbi:HPr kinase/phosphatase C-terminal domain-containing protein [Cognatiyoonia sp. IB215446]|uniref:HPr kinase/phosphorylase n=1 Tax=Cognatiyoonia sp. IB215446 TaxID=3097355 RepID=UPI002A11FC2D|nr:HPr kinase/phosphatase C-terminal domain-containing protein [Cognatiyoonia sp. IB215446]MDX8350299.1 HPr kinase/phosphatase C-terminal domain-containing protein [Cognatiyoonia sp. IB215446]
MTPPVDRETVHATCVAWSDRAVLILGKSGSGKSALGIELMALGCHLVADDRVLLERDGERVIAHCPETIDGLIEARGIGILRAEPTGPTAVALVVDLDQDEAARLPPHRKITQLGCDLPLISRIAGAHFAPAILQMLKAGRSE